MALAPRAKRLAMAKEELIQTVKTVGNSKLKPGTAERLVAQKESEVSNLQSRLDVVPPRPTVMGIDANPQITRLEQAVEAIAIEVERIGEAQRFAAKLAIEKPREPVIERLFDSPRPPRRVVTPLP